MKTLLVLFLFAIEVCYAQLIPHTASITASKDSILADEVFNVTYSLMCPAGYIFIGLNDDYFEAIGKDRWEGEIKDRETKTVVFTVKLKGSAKAGIQEKAPLSIGFSYHPFGERISAEVSDGIVLTIIDFTEMKAKLFKNQKNSDSTKTVSWIPSITKFRLLEKKILKIDTNAIRLEPLRIPPNEDFLTDTATEKRVQGNMFLYTGLGSSEILYLGVGRTFINKFSAAVKTEILPARANAEGGIGIKLLAGLGLRFSILFFDELLKHSWFPMDNISFEYCLGFNTKNESNPSKYQITLGSDKIKKPGINFLWAIGIATIVQKNKTPLILPSIKIGLINNF